jgi:hypothetical protein
VDERRLERVLACDEEKGTGRAEDGGKPVQQGSRDGNGAADGEKAIDQRVALGECVRGVLGAFLEHLYA